MNQSLHIGPIAPPEGKAIIYALDSDESSMIDPSESQNAAARAVDEEYIRTNSAYTMSVLPSSRRDDHFILDEAYKTQQPLIKWLRDVYAPLGVAMSQHVYFASPKQFAPLAKRLADQNPTISIISTMCFSYISQDTFPNDAKLAASRYVNAKTHLHTLAKKYDFSIPHTSFTTIDGLSLDQAPFYVKVDGLGGGANVLFVHDAASLQKVRDRYESAQTCIAQEAIGDDYYETIHLFAVGKKRIDYRGSRAKMTADQEWYGNIFSSKITLTAHQRQQLFNAARATQQEGYCDEQPLLLGIDAFMNTTEVKIIEFNARWLGSSPPEHLLRRLGIFGKMDAMSTFDAISEAELPAFQQWMRQHLYVPNNNAEFSVLPLGFSAYIEDGKRWASFIILGSPHAFQHAVQETFSNQSFELLPNSLRIFDHVMSKV